MYLRYSFIFEVLYYSLGAIAQPLQIWHLYSLTATPMLTTNTPSILEQLLHATIFISLRIPLFLLKFISLSSELFSKIIKKAPFLNSDKYKVMKQRNWKCNISPIGEDLKYTPKYTLEAGLRETIRWYKLHKWLLK